MSAKTLQIRLDVDEYQALQQLATAETLTLSDFCRQAIRLGVAAEQFAAVHLADQARRTVDRDVSRKQHALIVECALILNALAAKSGMTPKAIETVHSDAGDSTEVHFLAGDALEQALAELAPRAANGS